MFLICIRHLTYMLKPSMCSIHINLIIRWFSLWSQSLHTSNMKIISNKLWPFWYLSWMCTLRCNFNIVYIPPCRYTFQASTYLCMNLLKIPWTIISDNPYIGYIFSWISSQYSPPHFFHPSLILLEENTL